MSPPQIHLALNHLPIFAALFGSILVAIGLFGKVETTLRIGLYGLVLAGLGAVPVYLSGEPTEEIVEHKPGVSEGIIHDHEEAAEVAFVVVAIAGAAALVLLVLGYAGLRATPPFWFGTLLLGIIAVGLLVRTAHLGGLIRHDELRAGAEAPPVPDVD